MKFYSEIKWQMTDDGLELISAQTFDYAGPVALCDSGDDEAEEQRKLNNRLVAEQLAEQKRLQALVESFASQWKDMGFSPEQLSFMTSQFLNENDAAFRSANSNVRSSLAARGAGTGEIPIGGDYARDIAELEGMQGAAQSQGLLGIKLADQEQRERNRANYVNAITGNAVQTGATIPTFSSGASNALNAFVQAKSNGFGSAFKNAFGGALGQGFGKVLTGGNPWNGGG